MPEYITIWWTAILGLWNWMGIFATPVFMGVVLYRFMTRRTR